MLVTLIYFLSVFLSIILSFFLSYCVPLHCIPFFFLRASVLPLSHLITNIHIISCRHNKWHHPKAVKPTSCLNKLYICALLTWRLNGLTSCLKQTMENSGISNHIILIWSQFMCFRMFSLTCLWERMKRHEEFSLTSILHLGWQISAKLRLVVYIWAFVLLHKREATVCVSI